MIGAVAAFFTGKSLKLSLGALALMTVFATVQTIRIEGVWCSDVDAGEKPACIMRGFKQEVQVFEIDLAEAEANWRAEVAKHKATKQAYRDAQEEAARMEAERLARVIARQEEITSEVESDYRQRIAVVTARAERLRREARARDGSGAAGAPSYVQLPETGDPATRADATPDCRPFPARDPLTEIRCREIAEAQASQLDELITWVERQFQVEH
jgi:signal transduction histidine kinase